MTSAKARPESSARSSGSQRDLRTQAEDAMAKVGDVAKLAAGEAKRSAISLASEANEQVKTLLGKQVEVGADLVGHVAASARVAADDLNQNAPQLAGLVRDASQRMEEFAQEIRGQSIDQLWRRASDFTRERPAATFGAAAACGFFLFRLFKAGSAETSRSPGPRPTHDYDAPRATSVGRVYQPDSPSISPSYGQSHGV